MKIKIFENESWIFYMWYTIYLEKKKIQIVSQLSGED